MAGLWISGNVDDCRFPANKIAKSLGIEDTTDDSEPISEDS